MLWPPQDISDLLSVHNPIRSLNYPQNQIQGAVSYGSPVVRKELPADLRSITTVPTFKNKLTTFDFGFYFFVKLILLFALT